MAAMVMTSPHWVDSLSWSVSQITKEWAGIDSIIFTRSLISFVICRLFEPLTVKAMPATLKFSRSGMMPFGKIRYTRLCSRSASLIIGVVSCSKRSSNSSTGTGKVSSSCALRELIKVSRCIMLVPFSFSIKKLLLLINLFLIKTALPYQLSDTHLERLTKCQCDRAEGVRVVDNRRRLFVIGDRPGARVEVAAAGVEHGAVRQDVLAVAAQTF